MYKEASKVKLRFSTNVGQLTVEQLWDLSQTQLVSAIKSAKKLLRKDDSDDELSFLENTQISEVDSLNKLRFDILKDIYLTKKIENNEASKKLENEAFNKKIAALILEKQEGKLKEMSIEDLEKMYR